MTVKFLKNAWYVGTLSSELKQGETISRKIMGDAIVFYRKENGEPVALRDRCPHRFAPLSPGKLIGDDIACPYHGLRFNPEGQCTHNPHGEGLVPKAAHVSSFPLEERYGFIWIWTGDKPADLSLLPDYSELDKGGPNAVGHTYIKLEANYELLIDNVMDLSHIDHLHGEIISTRGQLSPIKPDIKEVNDTVNARWEWKQTPAMLILADFLPDPKAEARMFFDITWHRPANIQLTVGAAQGDTEFMDGIWQYDLHTVTPEDEFTTHYYFATRRNHLEDDAEFNDFKIKAMHGAFEGEDGPILLQVQEEMGDTSDFFSLNPVLMSNDAAPVKVRRLLQKLIAEETADQEQTAVAAE